MEERKADVPGAHTRPGVCPDNPVIQLSPGQRYEIDYDYCKGCGICVAECPSGAIVMEPEET